MTLVEKQIFVVDEHPVTVAGLAHLIEAQPGWRVAGVACSCEEALRARACTAADLVVLEPGVGGMDGLGRLRDFTARTPVLCFSLLSEAWLAERVLREGARGYLMKTTPPEEIVAGMRAVLAGEIVLSAQARLRVIGRIAGVGASEGAADLSVLNNRELQVVHLIGVNRNSRQIAEHMRVSEKTIATHRLRIREKLSLRNSSELVRVAARWVEHELLS